MYKEVRFYIVVMLFFCVMITGCSDSKSVAIEKDSTTKNSEQVKQTKKVTQIVVFVCGEVKHPGVYELDSSERIVAAIKAAGGLTKKAAVNSVNQAESMKDGQQIYIPSQKESQGQKTVGDTVAKADTSKVNVNSASKEELMTLTGIGEAKAEDIISYRQENGKFQKPEDIMKIQGIKEGIYNKIKDKITI